MMLQRISKGIGELVVTVIVLIVRSKKQNDTDQDISSRVRLTQAAGCLPVNLVLAAIVDGTMMAGPVAGHEGHMSHDGGANRPRDIPGHALHPADRGADWGSCIPIASGRRAGVSWSVGRIGLHIVHA